jgi:hypothetical protein
MRTTFALDINNHFVSSITPKAEAMALRSGMHVHVTRDIQLDPFGTLPKGACGIIKHVWPENGAVSVTMCKRWPALAEMDNMFTVLPGEDDGDASALQVCSPIYCWLDKAQWQILPRLVVSIIVWALWNYFVLEPTFTWTPITEPHAAGTFALMVGATAAYNIYSAMISDRMKRERK